MYFDHGVCVPGVDGKFLKVSLTQCHPSNAWSVFLGFGGDREGVVDVDVDTCGWRWMVLPGGFKYFLFLEISNPPCFFFGFHDPPIWGAYFFSKWLGWLGSNYQLDVDLFARFLTNSNSAGLNVTFFGDQVESLNVTFSTDRDLNHLVDVLLGEQWMKHTSVSVNLESWHPNFVDFLRCVMRSSTVLFRTCGFEDLSKSNHDMGKPSSRWVFPQNQLSCCGENMGSS